MPRTPYRPRQCTQQFRSRLRAHRYTQAHHAMPCQTHTACAWTWRMYTRHTRTQTQTHAICACDRVAHTCCISGAKSVSALERACECHTQAKCSFNQGVRIVPFRKHTHAHTQAHAPGSQMVHSAHCASGPPTPPMHCSVSRKVVPAGDKHTSRNAAWRRLHAPTHDACSRTHKQT
jgi:hypothetical protein